MMRPDNKVYIHELSVSQRVGLFHNRAIHWIVRFFF